MIDSYLNIGGLWPTVANPDILISQYVVILYYNTQVVNMYVNMIMWARERAQKQILTSKNPATLRVSTHTAIWPSIYRANHGLL